MSASECITSSLEKHSETPPTFVKARDASIRNGRVSITNTTLASSTNSSVYKGRSYCTRRLRSMTSALSRCCLQNRVCPQNQLASFTRTQHNLLLQLVTLRHSSSKHRVHFAFVQVQPSVSLTLLMSSTQTRHKVRSVQSSICRKDIRQLRRGESRRE